LDTTTGSCLYTAEPQDKIAVQHLLAIPNDIYHFASISKSSTISILNFKGKVIKTISYKPAKDFVAATISHQGKLIYAVSEDSIMYCFDIASEELIGQKKLCESEVIGISSHPFSNVVASNDESGRIYLLNSD
jgi:WD40 repeat-containing protein SMU1